jgi:hypothetical protein
VEEPSLRLLVWEIDRIIAGATSQERERLKKSVESAQTIVRERDSYHG